MIVNQFSLIRLSTNKCNVACEYCFDDKTDDSEIPEAMVGSTLGSSFKALTEVEFNGDSQGVVGSWTPLPVEKQK